MFTKPTSPHPRSIHGEVLSFALGSSISALVSLLLDRSLELIPAVLSIGLLVVAAWNMLYIRSMATRVSRLLEDNLVSIQYIHEPYDHGRGFEITGRIHETIRELVLRSRCQILVFGVHWDTSDQKYDGLDVAARQKYLEAIEQILTSKVNEGFDYTRIIQVPPGSEEKDLKLIMDPTTYSHCQRVANIAKAFSGRPGFRIRFFKTTKRMTGGFMLVDQRYLSLGLDGTSVSQAPCFSAHLLVDDRGGSFIREWRLHFTDLKDSSQPINLSSFLEPT